MLAEVKTVQDAANLADYAEAARVYARKAKLGREAEDSALTIRVQAEARMGQLVQEGQDAGQIARQDDGTHGVGDRGIPNGNTSTLADLGITAKQSHEAKLLAQFTDAELAEQVKSAEKASRAKVLKAAAKRAEKKRRPAPPPKPKPLRTPEEQADYDQRQTFRDGFHSCLNFADDCWHPNNIDAFFQGVAERPYLPDFKIDADRIRRAADRLHHIADEWKIRFPS